jgi:hypothetical protein
MDLRCTSQTFTAGEKRGIVSGTAKLGSARFLSAAEDPVAGGSGIHRCVHDTQIGTTELDDVAASRGFSQS